MTGCSSCGAEASAANPLLHTRFGNVPLKLCRSCRDATGADLTLDSVGDECASCGASDVADNVAEHALIPTLGLASTTVNLCKACREPVEAWHGTMTEARDLQDLGVTAVLLDKARADDIVSSHGSIAMPLANIGMAPALIAQQLNRRGYGLPEQKNGWTGESVMALVTKYRASRLEGVDMKVPAPSRGAMAQGN